MRWTAKPKRHWKPWFAFTPLRDGDRMIWLEPIWMSFGGLYNEWLPWDAKPNEPSDDRTIVHTGHGEGNIANDCRRCAMDHPQEVAAMAAAFPAQNRG